MTTRQFRNVALFVSIKGWAHLNRSLLSESESQTQTSNHTWSLQTMCLATTSIIPSLVNSVGIFIDGKLNISCLVLLATHLASFTASEIHQWLSGIGGVVALHLFSYSSKWWLAMWPQHVVSNPRNKHALIILFSCLPSLIAFQVLYVSR
jgi:hypothetical protein